MAGTRRGRGNKPDIALGNERNSRSRASRLVQECFKRWNKKHYPIYSDISVVVGASSTLWLALKEENKMRLKVRYKEQCGKGEKRQEYGMRKN